MGETAGGVLRRGSDRVLAGVCSGLGEYFHLDPLLVRIVFVVLALANGIGVLIYLVLWVLMDPPPGSPVSSRHLGDRIRAIGDEVREDFRTGFSRSQPTSDPGSQRPSTSPVPAPGSGTPPAPRASSTPAEPAGPSSTPVHHQARGLWFGAILVVIGLYLLVQNTGVLNAFHWDVWFWPAVLIAVGVLILLRRR